MQQQLKHFVCKNNLLSNVRLSMEFRWTGNKNVHQWSLNKKNERNLYNAEQILLLIGRPLKQKEK